MTRLARLLIMTMSLTALTPLASQPATAQSVLAVRAGDQPGLSRLVLDLPPGTQWLLEQDARQVSLRFPNVALEFDTAAVFPGRQSSRVLNARSRTAATGTVLLLSLACDCVADAFTLGPRKLIVDLRDEPIADRRKRPAAPPPRPSDAPDEPARLFADATAFVPSNAPATAAVTRTPVTPFQTAEPASALTDPTALPKPATPSNPVPAIGPVATAPDQTLAQARAPEAQPDPETDLNSETAREIERARAVLLERLAQAAEQGLVDLRPPPPPVPADSAVPDESVESPVPPPPPVGPGIEIRTARQPQPDLTTRPPDPRCPTDTALALPDWSLPGSPAAQIAQARAALIGEFDRIDATALAQLVRVYITLGFGLEAEALLTSFAPDLRDAALLTDLSRVIEARAVSPNSPLLQSQDCEGRAALWAFLAQLDPHGSEPGADAKLPASEPMLAALAELNGSLRRLVGPRLAQALLALGRPDLAEAALLRVRSAPGDPGDAYRLAEAAFLDGQGRHDEAEAIWRMLVARNRPLASEAMVALSESRRARGLAPPAGLADDLAARAFAARRSLDGVQLRLAEVETRAAEGDLATALSLLRREIAERPERIEELRAVAARTLTRARPEKAGTATFAAAVLGYEDLLSTEPKGDPARLVLATTLADLGLPNAALVLLEPPLARNVHAARLVAAEAQLTLSAPDKALALIDGIETRAAAELRAEAFALAGAHDQALSALPSNAAPELVARYAFTAGAWDRTEALSDPVDKVLAAYMAGETPDEFVARRAAALEPGTSEEEVSRAPAPDAFTRFLEPPRLTEPISLDLARDAVEMARASRDLLRTRIDAPSE